MRARLSIFYFLLAFPFAAIAAPIHDAAKKGDVAAINAALDAGADVNKSNGLATPLYYAVESGGLEAARLLIERGADVNQPSIWGPPLLAASSAKADLIKLLLSRGADPNGNFKSKTGAACHQPERLSRMRCGAG